MRTVGCKEDEEKEKETAAETVSAAAAKSSQGVVYEVSFRPPSTARFCSQLCCSKRTHSILYYNIECVLLLKHRLSRTADKQVEVIDWNDIIRMIRMIRM